jgi:hypothetical protein
MSDTINLPTPYAAARVAAFLAEHLSWTAFWDKHEGVWRVSENDPDSELYAASRDADTVIRFMTRNSRQKPRDVSP